MQYASIPVVASLIGYGTNVLAIQMTFLPLEYFGADTPPDGGRRVNLTLSCTRAGVGEKFFLKWGFSLGWQGIIPSKAEKMARKACLMITTKLTNLQDVFDKVEPDRIVECLQPVLRRSVERVLNEVALTHAPSVWTSLSFEVCAAAAPTLRGADRAAAAAARRRETSSSRRRASWRRRTLRR